MEKTMAVVVRPRHPMQSWERKHRQRGDDGDNLKGRFTAGAVYLLPVAGSLERARHYLREAFDEIFERELRRRHEDPDTWPAPRDWSLFQHWFDVQFCAPVDNLAAAGEDFWDDQPVRAAESFKDAEEFQAFLDEHPEERGGKLWSELVADYGRHRWDLEPALLDVPELEHLLLEAFPKTVVDFDPDGLEMVDELVQFFGFLVRTRDSEPARTCHRWLEEDGPAVAEAFEREMMDASNFDTRKMMLWRARDGDGDSDGGYNTGGGLVEFFDES